MLQVGRAAQRSGSTPQAFTRFRVRSHVPHGTWITPKLFNF